MAPTSGPLNPGRAGRIIFLNCKAVTTRCVPAFRPIARHDQRKNQRRGRPMKAKLTMACTAVAAVLLSPAALAADGVPLLAGKVVSTTGEALAGIPIKARRDNSPMTVAVYSDARGEDSFPAWSELKAGSYSVAIELPDFERDTKPVALADGKAATVDFTLKAKPLAYEDATASEIVAALPGTDQQKVLLSQCGNCHTMPWALHAARTKDDLLRVIKRMAGRGAEDDSPRT